VVAYTALRRADLATRMRFTRPMPTAPKWGRRDG
jgi:hypothetical protein